LQTIFWRGDSVDANSLLQTIPTLAAD
jgi:hypothetical protein